MKHSKKKFKNHWLKPLTPTVRAISQHQHLESQICKFPSATDVTIVWQLEGDEEAKQNKSLAVNIQMLQNLFDTETDPAGQTVNKPVLS